MRPTLYAWAALLSVMLASSVAVSRAARANTWNVTPDGGGDAPTIQAAIDAASAGDSIVLASGTYTWTAQGGDHVGLPGPSMLNMRSGLTLRSELGPELTILDAEGNGRVIRCQSISNVRIEGLTIQGGNADAPGLSGQFSMGVGGAILCKFGSSIVIANNVLRNNRSKFNGSGVGLNLSSSEVVGNVICWNIGDFGLYIAGGSAEVRGNTVASNTGGGVGYCQAQGSFSQNLILDTSGGYDLWCCDANVAMTCNDVWGDPSATTCTLGEGNIAEDPLVCITSGEFHVQPDSPCLAENNDCGVLLGARGLGCTATDVVEASPPRAGVWVAASPSPFNPQTRIVYTLDPTVEHVQLVVFDLRGRLVKRLLDASVSSAGGMVTWNGTDEQGVPVGAGIYIAALDTGSYVATAKLVLVK